MKNIEIFSFYSQLGYKIIPLHYCAKTPIFKNWNKNYNKEHIESFFIKNNQLINYGILLGDIVDIEGDCLDSNKSIDEFLKDIDHPCFLSKKSKHHLFRSNLKELTRIVTNGIEFRGYKHQSAIPPSRHADGFSYKWITKIYNVEEIPFIPKHIEDYIKKSIKLPIQKKYINKIKPNHTKVDCCVCTEKIFIHKKRLIKELDCFKQLNQLWHCQSCRKIDLRTIIKFKNSNKSLMDLV